ncbi:MAG: hypothetical protein IPK87_15650 [Planctomycetes bacterium]|nr:hypothetical protein [Planctomycetota bacterium]
MESWFTRTDLLLSALFVGLAIVLILYATAQWGPGLTTDSVRYMDSAAHIAAGDGLVTGVPDGVKRPLTEWPPGFPLVLAPDAVAAWARWVQALLFGCCTLMAFAFVRWAGGSRPGAALAATLTCCGGGMVLQFVVVSSETLFLPLQLGGIWAVSAWMNGRRESVLWLAGGLLCSATLTRYVGQGAALAMILLVALTAWHSGRHRLRAPAIILMASQIALIAWLLRNVLEADTVAQRTMAPQPIEFDWVLNVWRVATLWFWPAEWTRWFRHPATLFLLLAGVAALRKRTAPESAARARAVASVAGWWITGYLCLMFATDFLTPRDQDLDVRMMLPVMLPIVCVLGLALPSGRNWRVWCASALAIFVCAVGAIRTAAQAQELHESGFAFGSRAWHQSPMLDAARKLPANAVLASNQADAVFWHLDRPCLPLPRAGDEGRDHTCLDAERVQRFHQARGDRQVTYVLRFHQSWRWDAPVEDSQHELKLERVADFSDGTLFRISE